MEQTKVEQYAIQGNGDANPGMLLELLRGAMPKTFAVVEAKQDQNMIGETRVEYAGHWQPDLVVRVTPPHGDAFYLAVVFKNQPYPSHVLGAIEQLNEYVNRAQEGRRVYPFLIAPNITPETGRFIKAHGVNYLDFAGNRRIEAGDVLYLEVQGRKNPAPAPKHELALFTPAGTRIAQELLLAPPNHYRTMRGLAAAANVGLNMTQRTCAAWKAEGYLARAEATPYLVTDRRGLLIDWGAWYARKRTFDRNAKAYATGDVEPRRFLERMREFAQKRGVRYAVTNGFAAAAMGGAIEGGALELYCEPLTNTMLAELRIMPTQKQADLYIAVPKDEWILKRTTGIQGCLYVNAVNSTAIFLPHGMRV